MDWEGSSNSVSLGDATISGPRLKRPASEGGLCKGQVLMSDDMVGGLLRVTALTCFKDEHVEALGFFHLRVHRLLVGRRICSCT